MEELIRRWKEGDMDAFDLVYDQYKGMAMRTAYLLCKNQADSEDIVQETFVQCHFHIEELREEKNFRAWMLQILVRSAWKVMKKGKREVSSEEIEVWSVQEESFHQSDRNSEPLNRTLSQERTETVIDAINQLSEKHRMIVVLYYYNELSIKEIAKAMRCLEGTVKSRLYFARKQLKKILREEDVWNERWV